MFRMDETYKVRLGCDNCGRDDYYDIPKRREIINYERESADDPTTVTIPSAYQRLNGSHYTILNCRHCSLPALKVLWWKDEMEPIKVEQQ